MLRILVVDDIYTNRYLLSELIKLTGHEAISAENGEEAIEIVKAEKPDLIIMDIMMPGGMDGLEATRILKNDPQTKDSKIIILTAKGQQADREKGFEAGADDYFIKPFSPLELIKKVEEVIG